MRFGTKSANQNGSRKRVVEFRSPKYRKYHHPEKISSICTIPDKQTIPHIRCLSSPNLSISPNDKDENCWAELWMECSQHSDKFLLTFHSSQCKPSVKQNSIYLLKIIILFRRIIQYNSYNCLNVIWQLCKVWIIVQYLGDKNFSKIFEKILLPEFA